MLFEDPGGIDFRMYLYIDIDVHAQSSHSALLNGIDQAMVHIE